MHDYILNKCSKKHVGLRICLQPYMLTQIEYL